MRYFLLLVTALLLHVNNYAQDEQWVVKNNDNVKEVLGDSVIFMYPRFTPGSVYFRDGKVSKAALNLNLLNGEMQFISLSNDTMALADEGTIKYIVINTDTFYYSKVFIELVYGNAEAKLGKIIAIKPVNMKKTGAYEAVSSVSSINSASSFYNTTSSVAKLGGEREIALHKETVYFIGDGFNHFLPAMKKNIYEMFNTRKTSIETFIKENKIELSKEEDLVKLIDFLGKK